MDIGFRDIQPVSPADGDIAPFPQVQRKAAILHVLCDFQRKEVEAAVFMAADVRMPDDVVVEKK